MRDLESILQWAEDCESLKPTGMNGDPDGYDDAILGITDNGQLVYSQERMIELCAEQGEMDEEEAIEFLSFNTFCAYVGEMTPIYVRTMEIREYKGEEEIQSPE
jgi:hypothetical protein